MKGNEVMMKWSAWLVDKTGDTGFRNEEVVMMMTIAMARRKRPKGWEMVVKAHLSCGSFFATEMLSDICLMPRKTFFNKYAILM